MSIDAKHPDYLENAPVWEMIETICSGRGAKKYIAVPNEFDTSEDNVDRNKKYIERAVTYEVAGATRDGYVSLTFSKDPKLSLPKELEYLKTNADGAGVSIIQQSKDVNRAANGISRYGLYTTFPKVDENASAANKDLYVPTIHHITANQIINWRTETVGSVVKLSLVVIEEVYYDIGDDGYSMESRDQIRELYLDEDGFFSVRVHQKKKAGDQSGGNWDVISNDVQLDGKGNKLDHITFQFGGGKNNDANVDLPMLESMTKINKGLNQNSAELEDSTFWAGQGQPWMSGINKSHIDMMKENKMYFGSRTMIGVPSGETVGIATPNANPLVRQVMLDKIDLLIGMGARFIKPGGVAKTAEQSSNEKAIQHSPVSLASSNEGDAYTQCLKWCCEYLDVQWNDDYMYRPSTDLTDKTATPQELEKVIAAYMQSALPIGDYMRWMQRHGYVNDEKTVEEFSNEVGTPSMPNLGGVE